MNFSWVKYCMYKGQYHERKKRNSVIVSRIMETEKKKSSLYVCEESAKLLSCSESNNGKRNF